MQVCVTHPAVLDIEGDIVREGIASFKGEWS
jgi:hypothetical protein